jgi:hypothetical protein
MVRVIKTIRMRWARNVASMGERRGAYWVLVERSEGKRQISKIQAGLEFGINTELEDLWWGHILY